MTKLVDIQRIFLGVVGTGLLISSGLQSIYYKGRKDAVEDLYDDFYEELEKLKNKSSWL